MIGIVITGHIHFASGIQSALAAISGEEQQLESVDFLESMSTSDLEHSLRQAADSVNSGEGVLFLSDIPGGSPFQRAAVVSSALLYSDVISGTNLVMAAEACMEREYLPLNKLVQQIIKTGKENIKSVRLHSDTKSQPAIAEGDGI